MSETNEATTARKLETRGPRPITPLPWRKEGVGPDVFVVEGPDGQHVTDFVYEADADLIVTAVNRGPAFDALLAIVETLGTGGHVRSDDIDAALKLAGSKYADMP